MFPCGIDRMSRHCEVLIDEFRRVGTVCVDSPNLRSSEHHNLGFVACEKFFDLILAAEIEVRAIRRQDPNPVDLF